MLFAAAVLGAFVLGLALAGGLFGGDNGLRDLRRSASLAEALDTTFTGPSLSELDPDAVRRASEVGDAFPSIAERITPAVVRIRVERAGTRPEPSLFGFNRGDDMEILEVAGGTGVIVSSDGFILTNNHVVQDAGAITVILSNKREYAARVVGTDPTTDIALMKIDIQDAPAAPLGDSDGARVGEWVLAFGNPGFGASSLDFTVTSGIISAKGRPLSILNSSAFAIEDFIQTDAVINPGNSGGPLINLRGEVIGINTAIASDNGRYQGYGFAIPINLARRVMRDLVDHGRVRRALLGISVQDVTQEDAEVYGLEEIRGVVISQLSEDSPAAEAGLRQQDVIVGVQGQPIDRVGELQRRVAQNRPGDAVEIQAIRFGEPITVSVRLTEAPDVPGGTAQNGNSALGRRRGVEALGFRIEDATREVAAEYGVPVGAVLVSDVTLFGPAYRRGVRPGMRLLSVDGQAVDSARDATARLRRVASGEVANLVLVLEDIVVIANLRMP